MLERRKGKCVCSEGIHVQENERNREWPNSVFHVSLLLQTLTQSCENYFNSFQDKRCWIWFAWSSLGEGVQSNTGDRLQFILTSSILVRSVGLDSSFSCVSGRYKVLRWKGCGAWDDGSLCLGAWSGSFLFFISKILAESLFCQALVWTILLYPHAGWPTVSWSSDQYFL